MRYLRNKKLIRVIALFLTINFTHAVFAPYSSMSNIVQPEYTSFEPVDMTDMVNLVSGDFTYGMPIVTVPSPEGGYPMSLFYHGGIPLNQDASWAGLGWNINPGAITRSVSGFPDDWKEKTVTKITYDEGGTYQSFDLTINYAGGSGIASGNVNYNTNKGFGGSASYSTYDGANAGVSYSEQGGFGGSAGYKNFNANYSEQNGFGVGAGYGPFSGSINSQGVNGQIGLGQSFSKSGVSGGVSSYVGAGYNWSGEMTTYAGVGAGVNSALVSTGASFDTRYGVSSRLSSPAWDTFKSLSAGSSGASDWSGTGSALAVPFAVPVGNGIAWGYLRYSVKNYWLFVDENQKAYGTMYSTEGTDLIPSYDIDEYNNRKQVQGKAMDFYSHALNEEKSTDHYNFHDGNNLEFPNYDNYMINAQGLVGNITPNLLENGTLAAGLNDDFNNITAEHNIWPFNDPDNFSFKRLDYHLPKSGMFTNTFDQRHFRFEGENSSYYSSSGTFNKNSSYSGRDVFDFVTYNNTTSTTLNGESNYNSARKSLGGSQHVEWITNDEIINNINSARGRGFLECESLDGIRNATTTDLDGIGAIVVTADDGKNYHFSLPVYNFEEMRRIQSTSGADFYEERQFDKYASSWLLTGITGSDYIDYNGNGKIDGNDYGYFVKFNYGKWTDGYAWKSPYGENLKSKDNKNEEFSFGLKQLYYLNSVETRSHIALFVKKLRGDGLGTDYDYPDSEYSKNVQNNAGDFVVGSYETHFTTPNASFKHQVLGLKEIILLDKEDYNGLGIDIGNTASNLIAKESGSISVSKTEKIYNTLSQLLDPGNPVNVHSRNYDMYFQENILDEEDISSIRNSIGDLSLKTIRLIHDYSIGNSAFNSNNNGKLTLKEVEVLGKRETKTIPSYVFGYDYTWGGWVDQADDWGYFCQSPENVETEEYMDKDFFKKPYAHLGSLSSILMPNGSLLKVNYESDSYYKEALFALEPDPSKENTAYLTPEYVEKRSSSKLRLHFVDPAGIDPSFENLIDLNDWFQIYRDYNMRFLIEDIGAIPPIIDIKGEFEVRLVNNSIGSKYIDVVIPTSDYNKLSSFSTNTFMDFRENLTFAQGYGGVSYGGGIRVSSLEFTDGERVYETEYNYNQFGTSKTSGVTSYGPKNVLRYHPYMFEVPAPGVFYENVTVSSKGDDGQRKGYTRYSFEVMGNAHLNNDEELAFGNTIGNQMYIELDDNYGGYLNWEEYGDDFRADVYTRKAVVHNRLSKIGRINKVETFDNSGSKYTSQMYNYWEDNDDFGTIHESFNTYKSIQRNVYHDNANANNNIGTRWDYYFTENGRKTYPNILKSIETTSEGHTSKTIFEDFDFKTGQPTTIISENSSGEIYKSIKEPAFYHYQEMGSKNDNLINKNMMKQEAMAMLYKVEDGSDKLLSATIQTWSKDWDYRSFNESTDQFEFRTPSALGYTEQIYRKHKNYVLRDERDGEGFHSTPPAFNWATGTATLPWQVVGEVTSYDHYSKPLESRNINGNYVASKRNYNDEFVVSSVTNANYNSSFHTSFEGVAEVKQGIHYFSGEVSKGNLRSDAVTAHTGNYSAAIPATTTGPEFRVKYNSNGRELERGRTYRASVWVHNSSPNNIQLKAVLNGSHSGGGTINDVIIVDKTMAETSSIDGWLLLNLDINVPADYVSTGGSANNLTISLVNNGASTGYVDDFRLHPVDAQISGYVYDEFSGELKYIINNHNFYMKYNYDEAGRLVSIVKETSAGAKLVSEFEYEYLRD